MKKQLLNSIKTNNQLVNLYASLAIASLLGLVSFPFMGLASLAFICALLLPLLFVLMCASEKDLFSDLKEAKEQLGLSIFTSDKELLKKCLQISKSI